MMASRSGSKLVGGVSRRNFWAFMSAPQTKTPPLTIPFTAAPQPQPLLKESTKVTTLPNGVKVVSEDNGGFVANVGVFTQVGTRHEPIRGLGQLRSRLLFQSTENRINPVRVMRDVSEATVNLQCDLGRETTGFTVSGLRENIPNGFDILTDLLLNAKFNEWEVFDQKKWLSNLVDDSEAARNLEDAFHGAAYGWQTLGKPQVPLSDATESITPDFVKAWNTSLFANPQKLVIAGANIPHEALVNIATATFGDLAAKPEFILENTPAMYVGGDSRSHTSEDGVHVALGFGTPGFGQLGKKYLVFNLLHFILGSGADFSAGGPGKGIHTRLSQLIAYTNHSVMSVGAQLRPYGDSGLFYIEARVAENGKRITDQIISQYQALDKIAQKDFKNDDEIIRAKNRLKSHYFQTSEDEAVNASDLAYQVLLQGNRASSAELFATLDQVCGADVSSAVRAMLATKPTFAAIGNLAGIPSYHEIERIFK